MCLLLQVLHPVRDLVWLFRGGPPPGPAILPGLVVFDNGMIATDTPDPEGRWLRRPKGDDQKFKRACEEGLLPGHASVSD